MLFHCLLTNHVQLTKTKKLQSAMSTSKWKKIEIKSKRVMLQPYYSSESREMLMFAFHG